jgi:hypothetical protein
LAVGPFTSAVWVSRNGPRWSRLNVQSNPLFEFGLPPESYPTSPSRPAAARQLLPWTMHPYSTSGTEGPLAAGFACPLRSALRVWLPSRRFSPFDPPPVLFRTGGALGIHPSEHSPPERPPVRFRTAAPTYRSSCKWNHLPRQEAGPAGRGFWAYPSGSPWRPDMCLAHRPLAAPLGLALLGFARDSLDRVFTRSPRTRFAGSAVTRIPAGAPESRSAIACPWSGPCVRTHRVIGGTLLGFPHQCTPVHSSPPRPWLFCSPHTASYITADRRRSSGRASGLYRSCRDCLRFWPAFLPRLPLYSVIQKMLP